LQAVPTTAIDSIHDIHFVTGEANYQSYLLLKRTDYEIMQIREVMLQTTIKL